MTVSKLKRILRNILSELDCEEDEAEIHMVSNTYFLGDCKYFLGVEGYDGGFINLDYLKIESDDEEECEDED